MPAQLDDYKIVSEIGRGGMGVVYKAVQQSLNRFVAIKMIRTGDFATDDERRRFLIEAQAVARLQHPNIVQIYEVSEVDGQPYLSLEFVDGQSLAHHLDGTPLADRKAARLVESMARAIHDAHEKGVIHRDLKPSNVLIAGGFDQPVPKITDFGSAKWLGADGETGSGAMLGTPSYMAPEQVDHRSISIDRRTDVYGLGAVLYELLTGRPPFRAGTSFQTVKQVIESEPARPRLLNSAVPRDLETICLKCLEKEPARRYATSELLADDLHRFLAGKPVLARPVGVASRTWRWCRRNPVVSGLALILAITFAAGFAGILHQWRRAEVARRVAEASDQEAQRIVTELGRVGTILFQQGSHANSQDIEPLLTAGAQCESLLQRHPESLQLRSVLSQMHSQLTTYYHSHGQIENASKRALAVQDLWQSLPVEATANRFARNELATACLQEGLLHLHKSDGCPRALECYLRAYWHWDDLSRGQPQNEDFAALKVELHLRLADLLETRPIAESCLPVLQARQQQLVDRLQDDPNDVSSRCQFALVSFLTGEAHALRSSSDLSKASWRQAYETYRSLPSAVRDDGSHGLLLAMCCQRLMGAESAEPYYDNAIAACESAIKKLHALRHGKTGVPSVMNALLTSYSVLIICRAKTGSSDPTGQVFDDHVTNSDLWTEEERRDPTLGLLVAERLRQIAKQTNAQSGPAGALPVARLAADLTTRYAAMPLHETAVLKELGRTAEAIAMTMKKIGDRQAALDQATLARRVLADYARIAVDDPAREMPLGLVTGLMAKVYWDMGRQDEAMAAFREEARLQRIVFERTPSTQSHRQVLSKCYDRLIHWNKLKGDWNGVSDALRELELLWPDSAEELDAVAADYDELANKAVKDPAQPTPEESARRERFLAEARRVRELAKEARKSRLGASDTE